MGGQEPREEHETRIHNNPSCPMIPPPPYFLPFISFPVLSSLIFPLVSLFFCPLLISLNLFHFLFFHLLLLSFSSSHLLFSSCIFSIYPMAVFEYF